MTLSPFPQLQGLHTQDYSMFLPLLSISGPPRSILILFSLAVTCPQSRSPQLLSGSPYCTVPAFLRLVASPQDSVFRSSTKRVLFGLFLFASFHYGPSLHLPSSRYDPISLVSSESLSRWRPSGSCPRSVQFPASLRPEPPRLSFSQLSVPPYIFPSRPLSPSDSLRFSTSTHFSRTLGLLQYFSSSRDLPPPLSSRPSEATPDQTPAAATTNPRGRPAPLTSTTGAKA